MQAKPKSIILAVGIYMNEEVSIIDVLYNKFNDKVTYLINYGGPIWVDSSYISNVKWIFN